MNSNLSNVVLVVDRSGSMQQCRTDAQGGINAFIAEQRKAPGECRFTLIDFNHKPRTVDDNKPVSQVEEYYLNPLGNTALFDAVGEAITRVGKRLSETPESERPGLVAFAIVTDGMDNASMEYNASKIKEMITHQQEKYNWQFTFLGVGLEAFSQGASMGISTKGSASPSLKAMHEAYMAASSNVTRMRAAASSGQLVSNAYTPDEVARMSNAAR